MNETDDARLIGTDPDPDPGNETVVNWGSENLVDEGTVVL